MELESIRPTSNEERSYDDDLALLDALDGGAWDALRELWARYGHVTFWAAIGLTGDRTTATDAVVAAFVALQNTPRDVRHEPVPQHLVAAVRRRCTPSGTHQSGRAADESDITAACRTAVRNLTDQELTVLSLVMSQRYGAREAARLLDLSLADVCGLLRDVLRTLADQRRADSR